MKQLKLKFKGESLEALDKTYKDVKLDKDVTLMLEVVTKSGAPAPASANGAKGGTGAARGAAAARLASRGSPAGEGTPRTRRAVGERAERRPWGTRRVMRMHGRAGVGRRRASPHL